MTRSAEESSARRVILEQFQLVAQIGGSATIDDILKKMKENVIHGQSFVQGVGLWEAYE